MRHTTQHLVVDAKVLTIKTDNPKFSDDLLFFREPTGITLRQAADWILVSETQAKELFEVLGETLKIETPDARKNRLARNSRDR